MKKTKVLIPALGILLLSTAATVSGSLAWFTANRSVDVNATNFKVVNMNGSLKRNITAGLGTAVTGDAWGEQTVTPEKVSEKYVTLTDASFDYASKKLYTDVPTDDSSQPTSYTELAQLSSSSVKADFQVETNSSVYYALTWNVQFAYMFDADTTSMDLFFDAASTYDIDDDATIPGTNGKETKDGFRIAIIPEAGQPKVILPFKERPGTIDEKRVTGTTSADLTAYSTATNSQGVLIYGNDANATNGILKEKAADSVSHTDRLDYIGTIQYGTTNSVMVDTKDSKSLGLNVTFVVWFEGTDATIVNESAMQQVQANMKFYTRLAA